MGFDYRLKANEKCLKKWSLSCRKWGEGRGEIFLSVITNNDI